MKFWQRAAIAVTCGSCGLTIASGEPVLSVQLPGVSRPKLRCRTCAGEPVDEAAVAAHDHYVQAVEEARTRDRMPRVGELAPERFDAKMRAAGRDE